MERMILSLKNVYMLLMTDDFPIYSESVISKADRKGQTLLRFWQRQIAEEFRSLPYGRMIWRDDEKRNRHTSYLCNRSVELRCYQEYAKELSSQIHTESLLNQIDRFMEFLSSRKYKQDVLYRRTQELMRLTEQEDKRVGGEIAGQIKAAAVPALQEEGSRGELFQAGYLLTLLTLYAAAGEAMDDTPMAVLRREAYSLDALWQMYSKKQGCSLPMKFLTVHCSLLQDNPLPRERFFGREEELYDLWEMVVAGRKCIISGMGGIGKTELLRQLLRRCVEEGAADKIAVVPYIGSIIESFARAFSGFRRQRAEETFHRILYLIEQSANQGSRILMLIDNVDKSVEKDPALGQLQSLPCGIIITTRNQRLDGFETYQVGSPSVSAGMLIFRDNYCRSLTGEDRDALAGLLVDETMCHPATLRLMARAAHNRGWSVEELKKQLKKNGVSLTWQEGDRTVRLNQMYRQLYSYMYIPNEYHVLAELFTLLPHDYYSVAFLQENFSKLTGDKIGEASSEVTGVNLAESRVAAKEGVPVDAQGLDMASSGNSMKQRLAVLVTGGWLEYDGNGYSMHPLIAQCLRRRTLTEERLAPVLGTIQKHLLQEDIFSGKENWDEEFNRICHIFLYVCHFLSGNVSRKLVHAVLIAMCIIFPVKQEAEEYWNLVVTLMKRCPEKNDETEILLLVALARLQMGDMELLVSMYRRQKERLTVPQPLFLEFCIHAGGELVHNREFAVAEQFLSEGLCDAASPFQKATAYYQLTTLCEYQGNLEKKQQLAQEAVEYVTAHPECGEYIRFMILIAQCEISVQYGRKEAAESLLKEIKSLLRADSPVYMKAAYGEAAGAYELTFGSLEQALVHYFKCLEISLEYTGRDAGYYMLLGQIAIVLQRLGRFEEAISAYGTLLEYALEQKDIYMIQRFHNNLAVLYLELGKPEQAFVYLPTALEKGQELGGIALAEALRNTARAYGLRGDAEQECRYYSKAAPLLEEVYGLEHPRVLEAKKRLAELGK